MSSVGSSDSSNSSKRSDEAIRRAREDYRKAEAENAKKQAQEIRRLNEAHYQEVERLKQDHAKQMESMKGASRDVISRRDHKFQQDMDELRAMHQKRLKQVTDDARQREDILRQSVAGDSERAQERNDTRFEKLSRDYQEGLKSREKLYSENLGENREAQERAIAENKARLEKAHKKERDAIMDERNQTVGEWQKKYTDYRDYADTAKKSQEVRHMQDQQRASNNLLRTVAKERELRGESEATLREGFEDGIHTVRDRYERAAKKDREANAMVAEGLKSSAVDRIDNQVRRLEMENQNLKEAKVRNQIQMKQQQQREMNNIREAWGKNVENYREQRDEILRSSNERNAKDISDVREDMSKQLTDTNRFYRGRMAESDRINRLALNNMVGDFDARQEQTRSTADQRVKNIYETTAEEKARLIELHQANHEASLRQQRDDMRAVREVVEDDKNAVVNRLQDQMRQQELRHADRMNLLVSKYEKQIQTLKDQMIREKKLSDENLKRTVEELQRAHKVSIDQLESKNRDRMRQVASQQQDEVRTLNKRHEEKLDQVMTEMKKT